MSKLLNFRYHLLAAIVAVLVLSQTRNGIWSSDFWEHSAVVRELATNPWNPQHPQLAIESPHAFSSPYLLAVGLLDRVTGIGPIQALSIAGAINLLLLFVGLWLFISVLPVGDVPAVAFYSLLFILLLIGPDPPHTSGFLHLAYLGLGLPYPSTFSIALSFFAIFGWYRYLQNSRIYWALAVLAMSWTVILTHPLTFIFLAFALFAVSAGGGAARPALKNLAKLALLLAMTVILAALWPYYPLLRLLLGESRVYDAENYGIYLQRVSLAITLLGLPFIFVRLRRNWRDPLGILFLLLAAVYLFGYFTQRWSYGRVVADIVLVLDIALAAALAGLETRLAKGKYALPGPWLLTGAVLLSCLIFSYRTVLAPALEDARPGQQPSYLDYEFLSRYTGQYDVVLSDLDTSWYIPTFGGKIVATKHPVAFVPDYQQRMKDLKTFFSDQSDTASREQIAERYHAKYLLLNKRKTPQWQEIAAPFLETGKMVFENDHFALVQLPAPP